MINKGPIEYNNLVSPIIMDMAVPLLKNFNITTVSYLKFLKNGQMMHISNQTKWLEHYIHTGLYNDTNRYTREIGMVQRKEKNFFLRAPTTNYSFEKIMNDFGLCYGISLYQEFDDYIEMFGFATDMDNANIIEIYINNIELLKRFGIFFKDRAKELIDHSDTKKLITPKTPPHWIGSELSQEDRHKFLNDTTVKKFPISSRYSLSLREAHAFYYSLKGNSMKDIARKMSISPRTAETHLANVKMKLEGGLSANRSPKTLTQKNYLENIITYFECECERS